MPKEIKRCKCGAEARIRSTEVYTWVECKKKCGMKTGVYLKMLKDRDLVAEGRAVDAWNRMVSKDG